MRSNSLISPAEFELLVGPIFQYIDGRTLKYGDPTVINSRGRNARAKLQGVGG